MAKAIFGASATETNWDIRHYVKSIFLEQHTAELKAYFVLTLIIALIISNGSFHYIT